MYNYNQVWLWRKIYRFFWGTKNNGFHFGWIYRKSERPNKWWCGNIKYRGNRSNRNYFKPLKAFVICSCGALPIACWHLLIVSFRNFSQQQETVMPLEVNVTFGCSPCMGHFVFSISDFIRRSMLKGNLLISNRFIEHKSSCFYRNNNNQSPYLGLWVEVLTLKPYLQTFIRPLYGFGFSDYRYKNAIRNCFIAIWLIHRFFVTSNKNRW